MEAYVVMMLLVFEFLWLRLDDCRGRRRLGVMWGEVMEEGLALTRGS